MSLSWRTWFRFYPFKKHIPLLIAHPLQAANVITPNFRGCEFYRWHKPQRRKQTKERFPWIKNKHQSSLRENRLLHIKYDYWIVVKVNFLPVFFFLRLDWLALGAAYLGSNSVNWLLALVAFCEFPFDNDRPNNKGVTGQQRSQVIVFPTPTFQSFYGCKNTIGKLKTFGHSIKSICHYCYRCHAAAFLSKKLTQIVDA